MRPVSAEAGKNILAAGFDAGTVIKTAIKDGKMNATAYTPTKQTAQLVIDTINAIGGGQTVDYYQSYIPELITKDNADGYEGEF